MAMLTRPFLISIKKFTATFDFNENDAVKDRATNTRRCTLLKSLYQSLTFDRTYGDMYMLLPIGDSISEVSVIYICFKEDWRRN